MSFIVHIISVKQEIHTAKKKSVKVTYRHLSRTQTHVFTAADVLHHRYVM